MLLERVRSSRADAVIVAAAKMCEPGLEEQVAYTGGLAEHRIPFFVTEYEQSRNSLEQLETQIETFLENL